MTTHLQIWHPFTQAPIDPPPLRVTSAKGVYLYTADGGSLIDAISSWWVNLHGHGHPRIVSAIAKQASQLDHVLFAGVTHDAAEQLSIGLRRILPPALTHIFFSDDGSTAVEVALKIAIQYWRNLRQPRKSGIVALEHAYHGDTVGAMSVSADSSFTDPFLSLRFPVFRVHSAYCHRCPVGKRRQTCNIDCLDAMEHVLRAHHDEIAAVIVEPMLQGAGGMIIHPKGFLAGVRELCDRYQVLLIADEVLTGFGRCGAMFACELAGVVPDLMCLSKGITGGVLPMGATVCAEFIQRAFVGPDRSRTFYHGHSYTANPIACAAAIANLEIFECEPVWERIAAIGALHRHHLAAFQDHPAVAETRNLGTVGVIELHADDAGYDSNLRPLLHQFFVSKGVLLRPLGHIIYVLPPYVITAAELGFVYDMVSQALDLVSQRSNVPAAEYQYRAKA
jgi:adenosylmethionine-8-amino-7-oxononanoate aminotransferase